MKIIKIIVSVLFIGAMCVNVFSTIYSQKVKYFSHNYWQRFPDLTKMYFNSQYATKHPLWIPDEAAFSYAGGALIQGTNPVLVIPYAPPLGKYIIGVSTVLFDNEYILTAFFGIFSLFLLYLLSFQIFNDKFLALIPSLLFSFEPIFKNQFIFTPLFDFFQLVFLLSYFLLFNHAYKVKKTSLVFFFIANILLGCFIATKFFGSGLTIVLASVIFGFFQKNKNKLLQYFLTVPFSVIILLLSYIRVFAFGYTFNRFLGIQKWVFLYHQGQLILPFSVWPLLFFNQWHVWFGNKPVIADTQWSITWPLITIISFLTIILYLFNKIPKIKNVEILMIWILCYLAFFSIGQIFSRYFLILIPCLYIVSLYGIVQIIKKYR